MKPSKPAFSNDIIKAILITGCAFFFNAQIQAQTITESATGTVDGLFYSFWKDSGNASMTVHEGGRYQSEWDESTNNWVGGIGWNPGGPRVVNYSGTYAPNEGANSYLTLYGWTDDPFIEYFVIESYGSWNPGDGATYYGTYKSDGATYDAFYQWRTAGGINGTQWVTYYSIRRDKHEFGPVSGTITTDNHFEAWAQMGMELGSHEYMIFATEGYQSGGSSDITVSEGSPGCGVYDSMPVCCTTSSDEDKDGYGVLFTGEQCLVTKDTAGWHPDNPDQVLAAINVGGIFESVKVGDIWYEPSRYVSGGTFRATQVKITENADNPLYQSSAIGEFSIDIPIPDRQYVSVELGFAEIFIDDNEQRLFDVTVEGNSVLQDVDIAANVGRYRPWKPEPVLVEVIDGILNIELSSPNKNAIISSVLVTTANAPETSSSSSSTSEPSDPETVSGGSFNITFLLLLAGLALTARGKCRPEKQSAFRHDPVQNSTVPVRVHLK